MKLMKLRNNLYKRISKDVLIVTRKLGFWESNVNVALCSVIHIDYLKIINALLIMHGLARKSLKKKLSKFTTAKLPIYDVLLSYLFNIFLLIKKK
jgi:hypothetical protein